MALLVFEQHVPSSDIVLVHQSKKWAHAAARKTMPQQAFYRFHQNLNLLEEC